MNYQINPRMGWRKEKMKKMMIVMAIVAGFGFMSCENPASATSAPVTIQSVEIQYDGLPVYTRTTTLPVEITWSDGYVETDSVTVEGPADGPGIVPVTYDAIGSSSTHATTSVEFEDWRLVGTWKHESLDYTVTFNSDRSYQDSLGVVGSWETRDDSDGGGYDEFSWDDFNSYKNYSFVGSELEIQGKTYLKQ